MDIYTTKDIRIVSHDRLNIKVEVKQEKLIEKQRKEQGNTPSNYEGIFLLSDTH